MPEKLYYRMGLAGRRCVAGILLVFGAPAGFAYHAEIPEHLSEERVTWLWGHHSIPGDITKSGTAYWYVYPHTDIDRIDDPAWSDVAARHIRPGAKAPAVLMLHGCSGLPRGSTEYRRYFIESGFALFEPDSYARQGAEPGVRKCNRNNLRNRVKELRHAITEIRELGWVDQQRIFLMGFGEGGRVVAEWRGDEFAGQIIIGYNCWSDRGSAPTGPRQVPVLAVVGENDPYLNGSRCAVNQNITGSRSIMIEDAGHFILDYPETGQAIHEFVNTVMN